MAFPRLSSFRNVGVLLPALLLPAAALGCLLCPRGRLHAEPAPPPRPAAAPGRPPGGPLRLPAPRPAPAGGAAPRGVSDVLHDLPFDAACRNAAAVPRENVDRDRGENGQGLRRPDPAARP